MPIKPETTSTTLIRYALETLNFQNGGDKLFEKVCAVVVKKCIDPTFLPSSGLSAGGDGGRDGLGFSDEDGEIKYAFSIHQKVARKLNEEIQTWDRARSNRLRFFTNQTVPESRKKTLTAGEPKITMYDLENLSVLSSYL